MIKLLYTFFMAFWRKAFGCDGWKLPILKNRFVLHVFGFLATFLLCMFSKGFNWYTSSWIAVWIQIFWALGHGPCYDCGKGGKPDAKMLKRYEKMVGYKLVCKIFPEDQWYTFGFDFILLAIRYTYPIIPIYLMFNPALLTIGLVISALYGMYRYCDFMRNHKWLDVEIWAGLVTGLFIAYL